MPRQPPTFLTLPLELRLEIYNHLLVIPPPPAPEEQRTLYRCAYPYSRSHYQPSSRTTLGQQPPPPKTSALIHPQILRVNTQTNHEATPVLYTRNTFLAHPVHLTAQPTLYHPYFARSRRTKHTACPRTSAPSPAMISTLPAHLTRLIRHWHLRVRLDVPADQNPAVSREAMALAFSGADSLTLELWRGSFHGEGEEGVDVLGVFEGVRGVRRAKVVGVVSGLEEGYVEWLRGRMMGDVVVVGGRMGRTERWMGKEEGQGIRGKGEDVSGIEVETARGG